MKTQRLYGFWPYDRFPFFVGGEIANCKAGGVWDWVGCQGFTVKPTHIMPYEDGVEIRNRLNDLEAQYGGEEVKLAKKFLNLRKEIIK